MPSTLITAKGDFPDVCVLQMFRSVSSGWGYELKACFLLWLTADSMGLAGTAAPYTDCQEPNPWHSPVAAPAWASRAGKGSLGNTPLC